MITPEQATMLLPANFAGKWHPDPDTGCWQWTASTTRGGYGQISFSGRSARAHRVAWAALVAAPTPGMVLDHICHNPGCINPAHLREATQAENSRYRATARGNSSGVHGVYWHTSVGKWYARVQTSANGPTRTIAGRHFTDLDEAAAWVAEQRNLLHGDFSHEQLERNTQHAS